MSLALSAPSDVRSHPQRSLKCFLVIGLSIEYPRPSCHPESHPLCPAPAGQSPGWATGGHLPPMLAATTTCFVHLAGPGAIYAGATATTCHQHCQRQAHHCCHCHHIIGAIATSLSTAGTQRRWQAEGAFMCCLLKFRSAGRRMGTE